MKVFVSNNKENNTPNIKVGNIYMVDGEPYLAVQIPDAGLYTLLSFDGHHYFGDPKPSWDAWYAWYSNLCFQEHLGTEYSSEGYKLVLVERDK